jgi:KUP system potassium uptake protein
MASWRIGRSLLGEIFAKQSRPVGEFLGSLDQDVIARVPGTAIIMASLSDGIPPVLFRMVQRFRTVHERTVLLTVTSEHAPHVPPEEALEVGELGKGFYRVVVRCGFMDEPDVPRSLAAALPRLGIPTPPEQVVYVLGRETMVTTPRGQMVHFIEHIFAFLSRNARNATDYFRIPPEQVVELGTQIDL